MSLSSINKDARRAASVNQFERSEETSRQSHLQFNMKGQPRNLNRLKQSQQQQEEQVQDASCNRESFLSKVKKSENSKITYRGRIFNSVKKEFNKTSDKPLLLNLSNCSKQSQSVAPQTRLTYQSSLKDSQDTFWSIDINTPDAQMKGEEKFMNGELPTQPPKSKFQSGVESAPQPSTQITFFQKRKQHQQSQQQNNSISLGNKELSLSKQIGMHSNESTDNQPIINIDVTTSPASIAKSLANACNSTCEQKQQTRPTSSNISTIQPTPQITSIGLKSNKLRPLSKKALNKQNTLNFEDKLSDPEQDDDAAVLPNNSSALDNNDNKEFVNSLTQNQTHLMFSPSLVNNQLATVTTKATTTTAKGSVAGASVSSIIGSQINELLSQQNNNLQQQSLLSNRLASSHLKLIYQSNNNNNNQETPKNFQNQTTFLGSLSGIDQQKTIQTEIDENDFPGQNQSGLFVLDNCSQERQKLGQDDVIIISSSAMVTEESPQDKKHTLSSLPIIKQKSSNSKDGLHDLQEIIEDEFSTSNHGECDHQILSKQLNDFIKPNAAASSLYEQYKKDTDNKINLTNVAGASASGSDQFYSASLNSNKSPIKRAQHQQNQISQDTFTNQQYLEKLKNSEMLPAPTQYPPTIDTQNLKQHIYSQQLQNIYLENKEGQAEIENSKLNSLSPSIRNFEATPNIIPINQEEYASVGDQQIIVTEPEKQLSPSEKFIQPSSGTTLNNQITAKGTISQVNLNNDSNLYGSESTNEPNSVKKRNLTSSQLSNNYGKYQKSNVEIKAHLSSTESNNNSQETVKLQSNSKNFMEFAQYSNKRFHNDEEYEEPETIQYQPTPNIAIQNAEEDMRVASDYQSQKQLLIIQDNLLSGGSNSIINQYSGLNLQLKQTKSQQDQTERNSCDKFSYREVEQQQNAGLILKNPQREYYEDQKVRKSSFSKNSSKLHKKTNSNIRFSSTNNRNSPTYLENSIYMGDETLKSSVGQMMLNNNFHNKKNHPISGGRNFEEHEDLDKNYGQIPHIPLHHHQNMNQTQNSYHSNRNYLPNHGNSTEKENTRNYENHQHSSEQQAYQKQSPLIKHSQGGSKDLHMKKQPTLPSPHSTTTNVLYTEANHQGSQKNNQTQSIHLQSDQINIAIRSNQENNIPNKSLIPGDNSPSINLQINDYQSFWDLFKEKEDENRKFTCKEFCQIIWPQTLDRKKRHDKELVLKLFEVEYNKENSVHSNLLDTVSKYLYRFTHGSFQNTGEERDFQSRRQLRSHTHNVNQSKPVRYAEEVKRGQALSDLLNDPTSSIDLKVFNLIHILAFLTLNKDYLDQIHRKRFRKIQLFYLLTKISNIILQKFKLNQFDKCIKKLSKSILDFLNELFCMIFIDTIQAIMNLDKFEANQMTVILYDKVEEIISNLNSTEEILQFIQNKPCPIQRTQQTISNITH